MSTQEVDLDLDFTKVFRVPAALRPQPAAAPPPPPPATLVAGPPPNLVCFARPASARAVAPDAPVLVVEDHEPSRRMMAALLQRQGLPVRVAADSRECARELRKPPLPRLILLDVGLP